MLAEPHGEEADKVEADIDTVVTIGVETALPSMTNNVLEASFTSFINIIILLWN